MKETGQSLIGVERGIPIPASASRRGPHNPSGRNGKYPWRQMNLGDSFVFPIEKNLHHARLRAGGLMAYRKKEQGEIYEQRTLEEDGKQIIRIWRVA